jgi:NADH:ubiquinone oxidoreductase subunit D
LWRARVRCPDLITLWLSTSLVIGTLISDVVSCIGNSDIVLGSVDLLNKTLDGFMVGAPE